MGLWTQIAYGTAFLSLCSGIHLVLILGTNGWLRLIGKAQKERYRHHRAGIVVTVALLLVVIGHTVQVWIWALSFLWLGALEGLEPAIYFALSTYTTLGYGDLVLSDDVRVFAAFASVNGMLIFGVSTAYLVTVIGRVLPDQLP